MTPISSPSFQSTLKTLRKNFEDLMQERDRRTLDRKAIRSVTLVGPSGVGKTWLIQQFYRSLANEQCFWPERLTDEEQDGLQAALPAASERKPEFLWWAIRLRDRDRRNMSMSSLGLEALEGYAKAIVDRFEDYRNATGKNALRLIANELLSAAPGLSYINAARELRELLDGFMADRTIAGSADPMRRRELAVRMERYEQCVAALDRLCSPRKANLPLILVLDDLHNAESDPVALEFAAHLSIRAGELGWRLMIVASCWADAWRSSADPSPRGVLETMVAPSGGEIAVCELAPAESSEVAEILRREFPGLPTGQVLRIANHVGGSRLALYDLVRELRNSQQIFEGGDISGRILGPRLEVVLDQDRERRAHISIRLARSDISVQEAAYAASCLGDAFPRKIYSRLLQQTQDRDIDGAEAEILKQLQAIGLLRTEDGGQLAFVGSDALGAAARLEFRLIRASEIGSIVRQVVANTFQAAQRAMKVATEKDRPTVRADCVEISGICFRVLGACRDMPLKFVGLAAGHLRLRMMLEDGDDGEAARFALKLADAPARAFYADQWYDIARQVRLVGRQALALECLVRGEAVSRTELERLRAIYYRALWDRSPEVIRSATERIIQALADAPEEVAKQPQEIEFHARTLSLALRSDLVEDRATTLEAIDRLAVDAAEKYRASDDKLGVIACLELQTHSFRELFRKLSDDCSEDEIAAAEARFKQVATAMREEIGHLTRLGVVIQAGFDVLRSDVAMAPETSARKLDAAIDTLEAFDLQHGLFQDAQIQLILINLMNDKLFKWRQVELHQDDFDRLFRILDHEERGKTEDSVEEIVHRTRFREYHLLYRVARDSDDVLGMIEALGKQYALLRDNTVELRTILGEGQEDIDEVELALMREIHELAFRIAEIAPTEDNGQPNVALFAAKSGELLYELEDRFTTEIHAGNRSEAWLIERAEEICAVYSRILANVEHWPWPGQGVQRSITKLDLLKGRIKFCRPILLDRKGEMPDLLRLFDARCRADYYAYLAELHHSPLDVEDRLEHKRALDICLNLTGSSILAKHLGTPIFEEELQLWVFNYDGSELPSEVRLAAGIHEIESPIANRTMG